MLSNFLVAVSAVLPMFVLIGIGMVVRKTGLIGKQENKRLNRMVFLVLFGPMTFYNIYHNPPHEALDVRLIGFAVAALLVSIVVMIPVSKRITPSSKSCGSLIQAVYRSNLVMMGLPLAMHLCAPEDVAMTTILIAIIVPIYNASAVVILSAFSGNKPDLKSVLLKVAKNPLIIGSILGLAAVYAGIRLPALVEEVVADMAGAAPTMGLIILGISFELADVRSCRRNLTYAVLGRLVVVPGIVLALAALLGFRGGDFVALIACFSSPCSMSSYAMAEAMDCDGVLAGNSVIFTSLLSSFTMCFWIFLFKSLGMF